MNTLMFLTLRAAHILCAGVWIGSNVYSSLLLTPAIEQAGSAGGQVMMGLGRRVGTYMMALGFTTIITGIYLLWRFTGGFDPGVAATHAGLAFCAGGVAGVLAGIIGGGVVGRSAGQVMTIMTEAVRLPDGAVKGALMQRAAALRRRMKAATKVVIGLQATALVLMAVAHYV